MHYPCSFIFLPEAAVRLSRYCAPRADSLAHISFPRVPITTSHLGNLLLHMGKVTGEQLLDIITVMKTRGHLQHTQFLAAHSSP